MALCAGGGPAPQLGCNSLEPATPSNTHGVVGNKFIKMLNVHLLTVCFVFRKHKVDTENCTRLNRAANDAQSTQVRTADI